MVTIDKVKSNLQWFIDTSLTNWEKMNTDKSGEIKELLNDTAFFNSIGLRVFSRYKLTDDDLKSFLARAKLIDKERVREVKEYLGEEGNEYSIKWEEIKRLLQQLIKTNMVYINKFNMNTLQNNLTYKDYSKRYYAIINAKKVEKTEDIEYNPTIIINKSVALVDLEKVKEENYKRLEETKFFSANDDLLKKEEIKKEDNENGETSDNK